VQINAGGFFHCPEYESAGKQAMLAREEKQRGFRQRTGTDSNTLHIAAYQITAARQKKRRPIMAFFNSAITVLQTLVVALGAGLGIWGAINLLEGYGNDNPGANAHVR
jgi:hypothetical protein